MRHNSTVFRRGLLVALLVLAFVASHGAEAATTTGTCSTSVVYSEGWAILTWTWTSSDAGNVVNNDVIAPAGEVMAVVTDPGSTAPTDNWDLTIVDSGSRDVCGGLCANRDTSNTETVIPYQTRGTSDTVAQVAHGVLTLNVSNAGDSKTGMVRMYLRP